MSHQVNYSIIKNDKTSFDLYYEIAMEKTSPQKIEGAVNEMFNLQFTITNKLNTSVSTPNSSSIFGPYIPPIYSYLFASQIEKVDKNEILQDMESKINKAVSRLSLLNSGQNQIQPFQPEVYSSKSIQNYPIYNQTHISTNPTELAVGFGNLSNNCWASALLSMIVHVPSLRHAYETVANYHAQRNSWNGYVLQRALTAYDEAFARGESVSDKVSQDVRVALHNLTNGAISDKSGNQEDAHEALQHLMGKYEEIIKEYNPQEPAFSDLYRPLNTIEYLRPDGDQEDAKLAKFQHYTRLGEDNTIQKSAPDYQIIIPLKNQSHLPFHTLLLNSFQQVAHPGDDPVLCLLSNGKEQKFKRTHKILQFAGAPNELLCTLGRFSYDQYGNREKLSDRTDLTRVIELPACATNENRPIRYELDSFIVHSGGIGFGHYICFKKIDGTWIEANDGCVSIVDEQEIDRILQGHTLRGQQYTSYIHHYVRSENAILIPALQGWPQHTSSVEACVNVKVEFGESIGIRFESSWDKTQTLKWTENGWTGQIPAGKPFKFVKTLTNGSVQWESREENRIVAKGQNINLSSKDVLFTKDEVQTKRIIANVDVKPGNTLAFYSAPLWEKGTATSLTWSEKGWAGFVPMDKPFKFVKISSDGIVTWEKKEGNRFCLDPIEHVEF